MKNHLFVYAAVLVTSNVAQSRPEFLISSSTKEEQKGAISTLSDGWGVTITGGPAVKPGDLIAVRQKRLAIPAAPRDRPHIAFVNGDCWPGRVLSISTEQVRLRPDAAGAAEVTWPLSSVSQIAFTAQAASSSPATEIDGDKPSADVIHMTNRDRLTGTVIGLDGDGPLRIDVTGKIVTVPRQQIALVKMNFDLARALKPKGVYGRAVLKDGTRVSLTSASLVGDRVQGRTVFGPTVTFSLADLAALNIHGGNGVYLSDLTPARYVHTPYLGVKWPYRNDGNVLGGELRLGGDVFDKGLGLHSQCRISYTVPAGARRFESLVGLDDLSGRAGHATATVLLDDKPALTLSLELKPAARPHRLSVPIPAGVRAITLAVDFGRGGDVQDHVNWADARLIIDR